MFVFLDWFFIVFHSLLILFNSLGWIIKSWRKWNLITLLLTAFSWFGLGIFYGWGYCVCTDWHWMIRDALHLKTFSDSYIQFLVVHFTGLKIADEIIDIITVSVFFVSLIISFLLNLNILKKKFLYGLK